LPAKLYAARPACLFEAGRREIDDLVARAHAERDALIIALGKCCGAPEVEGAATVSAARCTEMLLGSGTYGWCAERGVLPLPPPYFNRWLKHPEVRLQVERLLTAGPAAESLRAIAAIEEARHSPDPQGMAEVERLAGRPSRRLFTGLGHLRETLREASQTIGLTIARETPEPIGPEALGPGDDCLVVGEEAASVEDRSARTVTRSLDRGLECVWVTEGSATERIAERLASAVPNADALREAGELRIMSAEALFAETNAAADPQLLVAHWIGRAAESLNANHSGLCLIHSAGWAESAGLSSEYALAYASRLSAACSEWPILGAYGSVATSEAPLTLGELGRTHPLIWEAGHLRVSRRYLRSEEYLGSEDLLAALAREPLAFTCAQAAPLISALVDGELQGRPAEAVGRHADECPQCGELLRQQRETKQALAGLRQTIAGLSGELWARVAAQIGAAELGDKPRADGTE